MCTKPAALEIQTVYENFAGDEDYYFVGASRNFSNLDTLDQFRQLHNLTFPISSSEELGNYYNLFNETFITLGNSSVLISKLPFYTAQSIIEESIEQSIVSFEGLYIIDDVKNLLLSESNVELNLEDIFYAEGGIDVDYSLVTNSNPEAVGIILNNEDKIISVTKNLDYGSTDIIIAATLNSTGDEIYSRFTIYNSSSMVESFETGDLSAFSWQQTGTTLWEITENQKFSGEYSIKSTGSNNNDNSNLLLTINIPTDDSISFAYHSTDMSDSDLFEFKIDGVTNFSWYGYKPWEMFTYSLSAGTHYLSWNYQKAPFESNENYSGYLDAIIFPENSVRINDQLSIVNYQLNQNYPNPFNPETRISYQLAVSSEQLAEIVVYNSAGQQVWSSQLTAHSSQLTNSILFDGSKFNSGIYYYSLVVDGKRLSTKSMVLIK